MELNTLESIVQSHPDDKKSFPGQWKKWRFELCLVDQSMVNEDMATPARPETVPAPTTFDKGPLPKEGESWRCVKCYNKRFSTMCFGGPQPVSTLCKFCDTPIGEAGWTIYKAYSDLPKNVQQRVDREESKLMSTLRTRWSGANVSLIEGGAIGEVDAKVCKIPVV